MAVKASAHVTLSLVSEIEAYYRYYLLQSSTLSTPSVPTTNPPDSSWGDTEPTYTSGSTQSLYFVDLTVFSNGTWSYSNVSLSSSYEAAKEAYNRAVSAGNAANEAKDAIDIIDTSIGQIDSTIENIGGTLDGIANDVAALEEVQSNLVTTETFTTITSALDVKADSIDAKFLAQVEELQNGLEKEVDERTALITASYDGDQVVGLTLGVSTNELSAQFTNEQLAFYRNEEAVITLSADREMLEIKSAEITDELQMGGFQWRARDNGNFGLVWIGGDE